MNRIHNMRQSSGEYPIYDFKKAMFLVACGNQPLSVTLEEETGRTRFVFGYDSRRYSRLWHQLNDTAIEASRSGYPMQPEELHSLQQRLWNELEESINADSGVAQ